jgi:hypothetical protein
MEETMKRIMTTGSVILMLALVTVLGAQRYQGGGGNHHTDSNPPNHNQNYHNHQNQIREFTGFLVVNERDIKHNPRLGFHLNLNPLQITHIDFISGPPRRNSYGIVVKKPGGGHAYYRLDKTGSQIAQKMLARQRHHSRNVYVEVRGRLNRDTRTIAVRSMERIRNRHGWDNDRPGDWG